MLSSLLPAGMTTCYICTPATAAVEASLTQQAVCSDSKCV